MQAVYSNKSTLCRYCAIIENVSLNPWDKPLIESDHFIVIPTLGAIVEGWLLVVPKEHYLNMGAIPQKYIAELREVVSHVKGVITSTYSTPMLFEHGPSHCLSTVGCGIDHAHLHVVPIALQYDHDSEDSELELLPSPADSFHYMQQLSAKKVPYLFLHEPQRDPIFLTGANIPSQYFRRLIAKKVAMEDFFDYKNHAFYGNIQKTLDTLQSPLAQHDRY